MHKYVLKFNKCDSIYIYMVLSIHFSFKIHLEALSMCFKELIMLLIISQIDHKLDQK